MKQSIAAFTLALACTSPAAAQSADRAMTASDDAAIDAIIQPVIADLVAGNARKAVSGFFDKSAMLKSKAAELGLIVSQIDGAIAIYGGIARCELIERKSRGTLAQSQLYLCQHERYLTRWLFTVFRGPAGWQSAAVSFDDKIMLDMDGK